jgi:hypothetical protein
MSPMTQEPWFPAAGASRLVPRLSLWLWMLAPPLLRPVLGLVLPAGMDADMRVALFLLAHLLAAGVLWCAGRAIRRRSRHAPLSRAECLFPMMLAVIQPASGEADVPAFLLALFLAAMPVGAFALGLGMHRSMPLMPGSPAPAEMSGEPRGWASRMGRFLLVLLLSFLSLPLQIAMVTYLFPLAGTAAGKGSMAILLFLAGVAAFWWAGVRLRRLWVARPMDRVGFCLAAAPALLLLVRWEATTPMVVVTLFWTLLPLLALAFGLGLHRGPVPR